jgi:hypothetical protein
MRPHNRVGTLCCHSPKSLLELGAIISGSAVLSCRPAPAHCRPEREPSQIRADAVAPQRGTYPAANWPRAVPAEGRGFAGVSGCCGCRCICGVSEAGRAAVKTAHLSQERRLRRKRRRCFCHPGCGCVQSRRAHPRGILGVGGGLAAPTHFSAQGGRGGAAGTRSQRRGAGGHATTGGGYYLSLIQAGRRLYRAAIGCWIDGAPGSCWDVRQ